MWKIKKKQHHTPPSKVFPPFCCFVRLSVYMLGVWSLLICFCILIIPVLTLSDPQSCQIETWTNNYYKKKRLKSSMKGGTYGTDKMNDILFSKWKQEQSQSLPNKIILSCSSEYESWNKNYRPTRGDEKREGERRVQR